MSLYDTTTLEQAEVVADSTPTETAAAPRQLRLPVSPSRYLPIAFVRVERRQ